MNMLILHLAVACSLVMLTSEHAIAQQRPVQAQDGSIAIGGSVSNSTIKHGLDEKEVGEQVGKQVQPLAEQMARFAAQVAREKGVEVPPLQAILARLGEVGVPAAEIPARLNNAADQLLELRAQLILLRSTQPELANIRREALALIDRGDLTGAQAVLNKGRKVARSLREEASRNEAELLSDEARISRLNLEYRTASAKYGEAAALVAFDKQSQWRFVLAQAYELSGQGNEFGDNDALRDAIKVFRQGLSLAPRDECPIEWAKTQYHMANALHLLGDRESGTERLHQAVAAYRAALKEATRERHALVWSKTQSNLDAALKILSNRSDGNRSP